jgi:hypothetical protein
VVLPKGSPQFMKDMIKEGARNQPLRNAFAMSNGMVPKEVVDEFIKRCNKGVFKGHIITAFLRRKKEPKKLEKFPL